LRQASFCRYFAKTKDYPLPFHYSPIDLPIKEIIPSILAHIANTNTLIVNAPPGAGKSTLLPLALMDSTWLEGKKIIMLEPRRLAAKAIASRMAYYLNETVGQTVGYRIRFESKISAQTKIEVVTEGILTRMLQEDNALEDYGLVIFDEFHERSIHADIALALCRECQHILRPSMRMLVMSATLNMPALISSLNCASVTSEGRMYPVDLIYTGNIDEWSIAEQTTQIVLKAASEQSGDILVFLPGQKEIHEVANQLRFKLKAFSVHLLYGNLPFSKQQSAIIPNKNGQRKIVLSTNIAETSLTIEGITTVVDSGFHRVAKFDSKSGLTKLETTRISHDIANQRAGRAGRLQPGKCYRMWSQATHLKLSENRTPEIMEADLSSLVLEMAHWGVNEVEKLSWVTLPPRNALIQAYVLLHELDALDENKITNHGKQIVKLPCNPRLAHMLIMSETRGSLPLACDIAALLEEKDPLGAEAGTDLNSRIEILRKHRSESRSNNKFVNIDRVAENYRRLFGIDPENGDFDPFETGILLTFAYPERIACARPGNNAQFQLSNGAIAMMGYKDDLAHESWLAVAHLDAREGMGKIFMAAPLNPRDLAPLIKTKEIMSWDLDQGTLMASNQLRIGSIVLKTTPISNPDPSKRKKAILEAIQKNGKKILNWNDEVVQWQNRMLSLRLWNPSQKWLSADTETLLYNAGEWIEPYLETIKNGSELFKLNVKDLLHYNLTLEHQKMLEKLAPSQLTVPSGSQIPLFYRENGMSPVLAVRIQELFGLSETPTVNDGKIPVLIHLLSPGYKPVQVTTDLKSFWNDTYFEVKKELKRRYPKHVWTDDPWNEPAIKGIKKKS